MSEIRHTEESDRRHMALEIAAEESSKEGFGLGNKVLIVSDNGRSSYVISGPGHKEHEWLLEGEAEGYFTHRYEVEANLCKLDIFNRKLQELANFGGVDLES